MRSKCSRIRGCARLRSLVAVAGLAAVVLSATACSPGADVATDIQVLDISTGWFDAGIVNGQNKLVPTVAFKLKNISDSRSSTLQVNVLFRRVNETEEWGTGFLRWPAATACRRARRPIR